MIVLRFGLEIGSGLAYLHDKGLAHCDVKSANVMLHKTGGDRVPKLIDVDSIRNVPATAPFVTPNYVAPGTLAL